MPMLIKLIRVMTYRQELPTIKLHDSSMTRGLLRLHGKLNKLYLHLQKTHEHQNRQGVGLLWETRTLKATWLFDHMINVRLCDNLKNLNLHFLKTSGH